MSIVRSVPQIAVVWTLALLSMASTWPDLTSPPPLEGGGEGDAAVIVGLEDYAFVPDVPGARDNAQDWYTWLHKTRGVAVDRMTLLRDKEATRERILDAIAAAAERLGPDGTLWFVFIGHGAPAPDGRDAALVGFDAQPAANSLTSRGVSRQALMDRLAQRKPHRAVVVLDACFSGQTPKGPLVPGLQPLIPTKAPSTPDGNVVLLTAARHDQFAGPLPGMKRPSFSYLLLGALRGWGDSDRDGRVTASEALAYTRRALTAVVHDRTQTPALLASTPTTPLSRGQEPGPELANMVLGGSTPALVPKASRALSAQVVSAFESHAGHRKRVSSLVFSSDGSVLASGGKEGRVKLWDMKTGGVRSFETGKGAITALAFSRTMLAASSDEHIVLWDREKSRTTHTIQAKDDVFALAFSDPKTLAYGSEDDTVSLIRVGSDRPFRVLRGHRRSVRALVGGSTWLASGSRDHRVQIWDIASGTVQRTFEHGDSVYALATTPKGDVVVSGDGDGAIHIWNRRTGALRRKLSGHTRTVRDLALTDDGKLIASMSTKGDVHIWSAQTGGLLRSLGEQKATALAFSPNGRVLAIGHDNGSVSFWTMNPNWQLRTRIE